MSSLLYRAVNHQKKKNPLQKCTALTPWHQGRGNGGGNLCDMWGEKTGKANTCTTLYDNFNTCVKNHDTERRRDCVRVKRPDQLRRTDRSSLRSPQLNLSLALVDGASFQLSLPTRSAMGAHSWPLVFPWQTAISQSSTSPLCSHRLSLLSSVPELTVWLQQLCGSCTGVCWSSLRAWHHSNHFCTLKENIHSLLFSSEYIVISFSPQILAFWLCFLEYLMWHVLFCCIILLLSSHPQYLQMKWPLLDVPGSAGLKDSRSPTPGHLVSRHKHFFLIVKSNILH